MFWTGGGRVVVGAAGLGRFTTTVDRNNARGPDSSYRGLVVVVVRMNTPTWIVE